MSYDDDKKLVVGFGAGMLRLWGIVVFIAIIAALFAYFGTAILIAGGIGLVILALMLINSFVSRCKFIRSNGKRCEKKGREGGLCPYHAKMANEA